MKGSKVLKFLGNGSCFNTKFGNNSAYHFDTSTNKLFLIDCGEDVFKKLCETNLLEKAQKIDVLITHLHTDHAGSLPSLIFFCKFVKNIVPTVIYPNTYVMKQYLSITGVSDDLYNLIKPEEYEDYKIESIRQQHVIDIDAYGYIMTIDNKRIFYSGDSKTLNYLILNDFLAGHFDYFYHDISRYETPAHMNIKELAKLVPEEKRRKVTCMHLDDEKTLKMAESLGFKVAVVHI